MMRRRQKAHAAGAAVVQLARREGMRDLVAYCGTVVALDSLDGGASIRVCRECARIAAELEAWHRKVRT